jgi:hypothetical protein
MPNEIEKNKYMKCLPCVHIAERVVTTLSGP